MSVITDVRYLQRIRSSFSIFREMGADKFNVRCPFCGDSQRDEHKARGYFLPKDDGLMYYCHNNTDCNTSFYKVLEKLDPFALKEYIKERFHDGANRSVLKVKKNRTTNGEGIKFFASSKSLYEFMGLPSINMLPSDHIARQYVEGRQIPAEYHNKLFYTSNFRQLAMEFTGQSEDEVKVPSDERLIIPFFNDELDVRVLQGRALNLSTMRYISLKKDDKDVKCYGLDKLDKHKPIIVVEGPIDSMFLPNCVASADADLTRISDYVTNDAIYVFDAQPRNKELVKNIEKTINKGYRVCLLPAEFGAKDINEMIKSGTHTSESLTALIYSNSLRGLGAKLRFKDWKQLPTNNNNKGYNNGKTFKEKAKTGNIRM